MAGEGENAAIELTEEERRTIEQARAAGVSVGQLLDEAGRRPGAGDDDPNRTMTRSEVEKVVTDREQRDSLTRARAENIRRMNDHVTKRVAGNERLKDKDKRVTQIRRDVMDAIPDTPALREAKTEADFYTALDKMIDETVDEDLKETDAIAGVRSEQELDADLTAERDAGAGTGGASAAALGDNDVTPAGEIDWAENPVYGLGVPQISDVEEQKEFQKDLKGFGKRHGMSVSA